MALNLYKQIRKRRYLRKAWRVVRRSCLSSENDDIRKRGQDFSAYEDTYLDRIYRDLLKASYSFRPAHGVLLGKKTGKPRPIVVGDISDRIVQRSILDVLQDQTNIKQMISSPYSFGGIEDGGIVKAICQAVQAIHSGARFFIKSDIQQFFQNIPRRQALDIIYEALPEPSLNNILDQATTVELANLYDVHKYSNLFPTHELGVAQGCCLSPFLGNILLKNFDTELNSGDCVCYRYIDDFLILGSSQAKVWKVFRRALSILKGLRLEAYHPDDGSGKALQGTTSKKFNYLGCNISPDFIQPDKNARNRLLRKIENRFNTSIRSIRGAKKDFPPDYDNSVIKTLYDIHNIIHAWGNHYSFCNALQIFEHIDKEIDKLLVKYLGIYNESRKGMSAHRQRGLLGLQVLNDCKSNPILPLNKAEGINKIYDE